MCSAVYPSRSEFGSAPASSSSAASSKCPLATARCSGVVPARTGRSPSGSRRVRRHLHGFVDVGARLRRSALIAGDAPLAHGKQQRREPGVERRAEIGAHLDERLDDLDVPFGRRPHQRRLSARGSPSRARRRRGSMSAARLQPCPSVPRSSASSRRLEARRSRRPRRRAGARSSRHCR